MNLQAAPIDRVLLVEPFAGGHHMALYLRHVVRELARSGVEISLLTTARAAAQPAYQLVKAELPDRARVHFFDVAPRTKVKSPITLIYGQLIDWLALRRAVREIALTDRPAVIYIPTVDWVITAIQIFGSPFGRIPFVALFLVPHHHRQATGLGHGGRFDFFHDKLFVRLLKIRKLKKLLAIDEVFVGFGKARYGRLAEKIAFLPDFGVLEGNVSRAEARAFLGIAESRQVLLVYGSLTKRKGIEELLSAHADKNSPADVVVIVAGNPSAEVTDLLSREQFVDLAREGRLVCRLEFHDARNERLVFAAADAVWVAYVDGFLGSSGILHQAVSVGLPVIANRQGLIAALVSKYGLGVTLDPKSLDQIVCGLNALCKGELIAECSAEKQKRFREKYSIDSHLKIVKQAIGLEGGV